MARGILAGMLTGAVVGGTGLGLISLMGELPKDVTVTETTEAVATQETPVEQPEVSEPPTPEVLEAEIIADAVDQDEVTEPQVNTPQDAIVIADEVVTAVEEAIASDVESVATADQDLTSDKNMPTADAAAEADITEPDQSETITESAIPDGAEGNSPEISQVEAENIDPDVIFPVDDGAVEPQIVPDLEVPLTQAPEIPAIEVAEVPPSDDANVAETQDATQGSGIGQQVGSGFSAPAGRLSTLREGAEISSGDVPTTPGLVATPGFGGASGDDIQGDEITSEPNALKDNAIAFEVPAGKSLMAVILLDDGGTEAAELRNRLADLPFPVNVAVDAATPRAGDDAAQVRSAGHEVLTLLSLPRGAIPSDVETGFQSVRKLVPDAVAVIDNIGGQIASDRAVATQLSLALAESGHGLVLYNAGLNTAAQLAGRAGVPNTQVFRNLASVGENAHAIRRMLQRAEFKARQDGDVVLTGKLNAETLRALQEWALDDRSGQTVLAPVSAVLLQQ
ncbi:divergent polysaccharide deacetylase family protein [Halocynthiibacter sp.]|uniref:divergent polysaccharide deacetylase family protein n=1 Tax=Halocynthiibacter sp. TaxID=1979210 RepID=UPI003C4F900D